MTSAADTAPAFRFDVPQEFHRVPLGIEEDGETLTNEAALDSRMREFSTAFWGDAAEREPLRRLMAAAETANAEQLRESGAVYHAMGVFPIGGTADGTQRPERVSRCNLLVSVRAVDNPGPHMAAAGISETLERAEDGGEVHQIDLPAGPAVVHLAAQRMVWSFGETAGQEGRIDGHDVERYALRIEVWLPFPDQDRLLLLCLSTTDTQDLFLYQGVLAEIAESITFGGDELPASPDGRRPTPVGATDTAWQSPFG
jgi:hypothetical protein